MNFLSTILFALVAVAASVSGCLAHQQERLRLLQQIVATPRHRATKSTGFELTDKHNRFLQDNSEDDKDDDDDHDDDKDDPSNVKSCTFQYSSTVDQLNCSLEELCAYIMSDPSVEEAECEGDLEKDFSIEEEYEEICQPAGASSFGFKLSRSVCFEQKYEVEFEQNKTVEEKSCFDFTTGLDVEYCSTLKYDDDGSISECEVEVNGETCNSCIFCEGLKGAISANCTNLATDLILECTEEAQFILFADAVAPTSSSVGLYTISAGTYVVLTFFLVAFLH